MKIQANGLQLEVDVQGPADGTPLLLIMGLGMQLVAWPEALVAALVLRGFRVIRFDNRDIGLSQGFEAAGVPNLTAAWLRFTMQLPVPAPYQLSDMALDAVGVLDALGVAQAHVLGASMGGMVAQHLGARHAGRIKSLTLLMTTSGARLLPQPGWRVKRLLMNRPRSKAVDDVVAHLEALLALIGSPAYPADPLEQRALLRAVVQRAWRPSGSARQLLAIAADGDRSPMLADIQAPTAVIHGTEDLLVPPEAAKDLARKIRGATLELIPGMGHDLPQALLPRLAEAVAVNARRALAG